MLLGCLGLNLSREVGTHFSQESLLSSSYALCKKLSLPLILHVTDVKSLERALELLFSETQGEGDDEGESSSNEVNIIIHDVLSSTGADLSLKTLLLSHSNLYYMVSGVGITDTDAEIQEKARTFFADFPGNRMLVGTDSPWKTPQNLSDTYLRTLRNESSNIEFIVNSLADVMKVDVNEFTKILKENTLTLFGMESLPMMNATPGVGGMKEMETIHDEGEEEENEDETEDVTKHVKEMKIDHKKQGKKEKEKSSKKDKKSNKSKISDDDDEDEEESNAAADTALEKLKGSKTSPKPSDTVASKASSQHYKCSKCRHLLFASKDMTSHSSLGAGTGSTVKTVFKVGEEGLCSSFYFLPAADGRDIHHRLGVQIRGGNVECSSCGMKLGKYSPSEAICSCGKVIAGPVAKVNANKIDFIDESLDTQELVERSKLENQTKLQQLEVNEEEEEMRQQLAAIQDKSKKVKKHKSENRGNFSNFRNKSFIPNASKGKKGGKDDDDDEEDADDNNVGTTTGKKDSKKAGKKEAVAAAVDDDDSFSDN
jgi:Tat protein secretion system quality control protein TatD with DNase activity